MKKTFLLIIVCFLLQDLRAQPLLLTGQTMQVKDSSLILVLLYADGHYSTPSIKLKLKEDGTFSNNISLPYPVFALLKFDGREQRLLLSPGRNLRLSVTGSAKDIRFTGPGAEENQLINDLKLGSIPFFMEKPYNENPFAQLSLDSLEHQLINKLDKDLEKITRKIIASSLPKDLKRILSSEMRYVTQCYLHDLTRNDMRWAKNPASDKALERVLAWQPLPDSLTLVNGFYANMMVGYQQSCAVNGVAKGMKADKASAIKRIEQMLQMPFDDINKLVKEYGERYIISWLYTKNNLPRRLQDKVLFNKVVDAYNDGSTATARYLFDTLTSYFPKSPYIHIVKPSIDDIDNVFRKQANNTAIRLYPDKKLASLEEFIKPYKGKIIYLDIWGTWCGPCRMEMPYVADLKKRFSGKDIVFLYLDMDDDSKEKSWIDYVRFYGIEGEHYRVNAEQIKPYWETLQKAGAEPASYPRYVIFDKEGKIIHVNAERPSSKEVLYKQLNEVL